MQKGKIFAVRRSLSLSHYRLHLEGKHRLGVYPLLPDGTTRFLAFDFDGPDAVQTARRVYAWAKPYGLPLAWEISKSRGIHLWLFFSEPVSAKDVRHVARIILDKAHARAEIFPKQDALPEKGLGNFIWLPLSGESQKQGRTLFVDPDSLKAYPDQGEYLAEIPRLSGRGLAEIARVKDFHLNRKIQRKGASESLKTYQGDLLPCARRMLEGVNEGCRDVAAFRLAIHFKSRGDSMEEAERRLQEWNRTGNRPPLPPEVISLKVRSAYHRGYSGYGCEDPLIIPFCEETCPVKQKTDTTAVSVAEEIPQ
jgi:hypothetical protein